MNSVGDVLRVAAGFTALAAGAVIVTALAPLVSLVAVPIFAIKASLRWNEHQPLYNRTLTNQTREKFGRVPGQDYMRWDGKANHQVNANPTWAERMHEAMDSYVHGSRTRSFRYDSDEEAPDSPFRTREDLEWLNREFVRKEKKDLLDSDLKMLRAFSKALIPLIGVIWVFFTELTPGGASEMGCRVCAMGGDAEETHWQWREAIDFHRKSIRRRLASE